MPGKVIRSDRLTEQGFFGPLKLPLGPTLTQSLNADDSSFRGACSVLAMIAGHGKREERSTR
jgi:hypothetical protein